VSETVTERQVTTLDVQLDAKALNVEAADRTLANAYNAGYA